MITKECVAECSGMPIEEISDKRLKLVNLMYTAHCDFDIANRKIQELIGADRQSEVPEASLPYAIARLEKCIAGGK